MNGAPGSGSRTRNPSPRHTAAPSCCPAPLKVAHSSGSHSRGLTVAKDTQAASRRCLPAPFDRSSQTAPPGQRRTSTASTCSNTGSGIVRRRRRTTATPSDAPARTVTDAAAATRAPWSGRPPVPAPSLGAVGSQASDAVASGTPVRRTVTVTSWGPASLIVTDGTSQSGPPIPVADTAADPPIATWTSVTVPGDGRRVSTTATWTTFWPGAPGDSRTVTSRSSALALRRLPAGPPSPGAQRGPVGDATVARTAARSATAPSTQHSMSRRREVRPRRRRPGAPDRTERGASSGRGHGHEKHLGEQHPPIAADRESTCRGHENRREQQAGDDRQSQGWGGHPGKGSECLPYPWRLAATKRRDHQRCEENGAAEPRTGGQNVRRRQKRANPPGRGTSSAVTERRDPPCRGDQREPTPGPRPTAPGHA